MKNWIELSELEYEKVWNKIDDDLKFKPSISRFRFRPFKVPSPFITYDISDYYGEINDLEVYDDLEEKTLLVFQDITTEDEWIYALDWQHQCYWINPYLEFEKNEFDEWKIPIFPNGDYYFYINKNFEWGILGHPWKQTITIFGKDLINSFEKHQPRMFQKKLDKSF